MLRLVLTLLVVSYASAKTLPSICHSNVQQKTEAQVVAQLANTCDRNNDGTVKEVEIVVAFAEIIEYPLAVPEAVTVTMDYDQVMQLAGLLGFSVTKHDFVQKWHARFHDSLEFIGAIFDAYDSNTDGTWDVQEVDSIIKHIKATAANGVISKAEFTAYFTSIYMNC